MLKAHPAYAIWQEIPVMLYAVVITIAIQAQGHYGLAAINYFLYSNGNA